MAASVTATETIHTSVKQIHWAVVSSTDGDATGATSYPYDGKLIALVTNPSTSAAPTDNWDMTVTDAGGVDVCLGGGANRHTSTTQSVAEASLGAVCGSVLTLNVENAGDTKGLDVYLYIR